MIERWFVVGRDGHGSRHLLATDSTPKLLGWAIVASGARLGRIGSGIIEVFTFTSRDSARSALTMAKLKRTHLARSARIVRVRIWSKGERAKLACDWAGIPTLENGKAISIGRRVELLAERAMGLGATVHQQRAKLLDLGTKLDLAERAVERNKPAPGVVEAALKRSKQPRKRPAQRGNRS